jgi:tetratricopeptide (TPR) repeat protein
MAFRGDLVNINLASVFQNLLHNEQSGTLRIFEKEREAFIHFVSGRMTMYSSGAGDRTPLAEYLLRSETVSEKQIATASKRLRGRRNLSTVLTRMGIERATICDAVQRFVTEEVCDLFTWETGRFEFLEGLPPAGIFDSDMAGAGLEIDTNGIILEAARRADTWDRINKQIRSDSEIYVVRKDMIDSLETSFEVQVATVAGMLDGQRNVTALAEESGLGRFPVLNALSQLLSRGAIRPISLTEVLGLAATAMAANDYEEAVRFFRRALEIEHNNLDCRRGLIKALEGSGEKTSASSERKMLAVTLQAMGNLEEAAEELRRAIEGAPTDITAREKYIGLLQTMNAEEAAEEARLQLGQTYLSLGVAEKAREVFATILKDRPRDPFRVAMMLAESCVKGGEVEEGINAYLKAASMALAAEKYPRAAEACGQVLKLKPDHPEALKWLEDINTGKLLQRKQRWRIVKYALLATCMAVLTVSWLVYDWMGRDFLDEMSVQAIERCGKDDYRGAIDCLTEVSQRFPFTKASLSAYHLRTAVAQALTDREKKILLPARTPKTPESSTSPDSGD